jgi:uncharacterized protein (DUF885 family)
MGENVYIVIGLSGAIAGCYVAVIQVYRWAIQQVSEQDKTMDKHMQNRNVHPDAVNVVYRDTCDANRAGLHQQVNNTDKKIDDLKKDMGDRFDRLEKLITSGNKGG